MFEKGLCMWHLRVGLFRELIAMALTLAVAPLAWAEPVKIHSDYAVTLIGFPVAYMSFVTEIDEADYTISADLRSSALSDIVSRTRGKASVTGKLSKDRFVASRFSAAYSSGKEAQRTEIVFRNGSVKSATNTPSRKRKAADWVPLSAKDLRAVVDPLSSLVFPLRSRVCPRKLPIFDGQSRVTLYLSYKGTRPFRSKGFEGDAIVCAVRFEPNSGYRKGSSGVRYLQKLKTMEIWFGKNEEGGFFAPVYAKIPTSVGQVAVSATRFGG